ncbi:hypothetical protein B0H13DRAFT_2654730 [Mycena leptocephala]|nr:hypothetical protein B0H13DRAFT_2654730 [Mycena leptocephala]
MLQKARAPVRRATQDSERVDAPPDSSNLLEPGVQDQVPQCPGVRAGHYHNSRPLFTTPFATASPICDFIARVPRITSAERPEKLMLEMAKTLTSPSRHLAPAYLAKQTTRARRLLSLSFLLSTTPIISVDLPHAPLSLILKKNMLRPSLPSKMEREARDDGLAVEGGGGDRQSTVSEDIGLAYMNMGDAPEENERNARPGCRSITTVHEARAVVRVGWEWDPTLGSRLVIYRPVTGLTQHVPPPTMDLVEDEHALNAAAAREVSRELDALNFRSYAPPPNREPSLLIPPVAPFSHKDSTPGHQSTPSWDASPVPPARAASPSSPRPETPYRAPIAARSTSSLNTQPPPGARTISAAAFRRPLEAPSSGDLVADTSPLSLKKRLPAAGEPVPAAAHGVDVAGRVAAAGRPIAPASPAASPPQEDDAPFGYISVYTNGELAGVP